MGKEIKLTLFAVLLTVIMISCDNQDIEFPDFDYTTSYFPYQYPVRTLVLGDYYFENEDDNKLKFTISATMGGVYENKKDVVINFVVDESLVANMYLRDKQISPLPKEYYTLSDNSQIIIPQGELAGGVDVQLTEAFLNDPDAISRAFSETTYVLPLRIISASTDSILSGKAAAGVTSPELRLASDWEILPMNFTLFGINYVNEYHGKFLLRGASGQYDGTNLLATSVYRTRDIETDRVVDVSTASKNAVTFTKDIARAAGTSPGNFTMRITFGADGTGAITPDEGSSFPVTGTARFVKDSESWGGKKRHAIYLDYVVDDGEYLNKAKDTLVFRDKGITFQLFEPTLVTD
ncbi:MAG: DUF5627 domain-containing protein [Prolixibacteraceae bacterium]